MNAPRPQCFVCSGVARVVSASDDRQATALVLISGYARMNQAGLPEAAIPGHRERLQKARRTPTVECAGLFHVKPQSKRHKAELRLALNFHELLPGWGSKTVFSTPDKSP